MKRCVYCRQLIVLGAVGTGTGFACPGCVETARLREREARQVAHQTAQERARREQELEYLRQAKEAYSFSLGRLKERPDDPDRKQKALQLGRLYASWTGYFQGDSNVTLFDEVALGNDLQAACAAASVVSSAGPPAPEERLHRLEALREKGLVTEQEYESKRAEIISGL
jgi:predicted RNA-binding Zn-ribbon protein involved in translation (DUF1610 family)